MLAKQPITSSLQPYTVSVRAAWNSCLDEFVEQLGYVCGLVSIKEQTPSRHVIERDCTSFSNFINYVTLNSEHDWEDLCI